MGIKQLFGGKLGTGRHKSQVCLRVNWLLVGINHKYLGVNRVLVGIKHKYLVINRVLVDINHKHFGVNRVLVSIKHNYLVFNRVLVVIKHKFFGKSGTSKHKTQSEFLVSSIRAFTVTSKNTTEFFEIYVGKSWYKLQFLGIN